MRIMAPFAMPHLTRRQLLSHATAWVWLIAAVLLLKAAVPLLAALAAQRQGVALAEVCSIHGVSIAAADAMAADPHDGPSGAADPVAKPQCPLTSLSSAPAHDAPMPAVLTHAPRRAALPLPPPQAPPSDASQRWLAWHLHSPPVPV